MPSHGSSNPAGTSQVRAAVSKPSSSGHPSAASKANAVGPESVLHWLNVARTRPREFMGVLQSRVSWYGPDKVCREPGQTPVRTAEGIVECL